MPVDGISHYDAMITIPKIHGVEKHFGPVVPESLFPGLPCIRCNEYARRRSRTHNYCMLRIKGLHVAKITFFITPDRMNLEVLPAILAHCHGTAVSARPDHTVIHNTQAAKCKLIKFHPFLNNVFGGVDGFNPILGRDAHKSQEEKKDTTYTSFHHSKLAVFFNVDREFKHS